MRRGFTAGLAVLSLFFIVAPASAQRPVTAADSLRLRLDSLMRQVDSLRAMVVRLQSPQGDTMDALARIRAAAAAAAGQARADSLHVDTAGSPEFVSRQRNLNALNPEISVTGDVFAFSRSTDSDVDNFVPREFEISFISNLDPYSRAKVFVAHHTHGGGIEPFAHEEEGEHDEAESETEIEEGYVEWVNLAGGLGVSVGKFRQRFGKLNRWHTHALPGQQLPLPYLAFMGEEGLAQTGVSVHWLLPIHSGGTYEFWGDITRSGNTLFGESRQPNVLAHVNGFWELSPATYFELGLSGIAGARSVDDDPTADGARMLGADFTFDWRPPERARYRQFTLHGAAMTHHRTFDGEDAVTALGAFLQAEYKFSTRWTVGGRWEFAENPDDPDESAWLGGPTLTWWQSEFVRLRSEYQIFRGPEERFGQFVFQATFAMGPHKHENY